MSEIPLTPDQQRVSAEQYQNFGRLLSTGGSIAPNGALELTASQIRNIKAEEELKPQLPEFLVSTPEGQQISRCRDELNELSAGIADRLGHAVSTTAFNRFKEKGGMLAYYKVMEFNSVSLDWRQILQETPKEPETALEMALKTLETHRSSLYQLSLDLIEFPKYRFGKEYAVMRKARNSQPARKEAGWVFQDITARGLLRLYSEGSYKDVPLPTLRRWNDDANS